MKNKFTKTCGVIGVSLIMLFLVNTAFGQTAPVDHPLPTFHPALIGPDGKTMTTNLLNPSLSAPPSIGANGKVVTVDQMTMPGKNHPVYSGVGPKTLSVDSKTGTVVKELQNADGTKSLKTYSKPAAVTITIDKSTMKSNQASGKKVTADPKAMNEWMNQFGDWAINCPDWKNFLTTEEKDAFNNAGINGIYLYDNGFTVLKKTTSGKN